MKYSRFSKTFVAKKVAPLRYYCPMPNRRIPTSTKASVARLNRQGVSQREISETLKLGRATVKRLLEAAPSLPTPETPTRETPGAVMDIPPELLALGVPIRTARDLLAATDAKRKMLRLAERKRAGL